MFCEIEVSSLRGVDTEATGTSEDIVRSLGSVITGESAEGEGSRGREDSEGG